MLDADARARLLARHGAAAEPWLDALPARLAPLAARWRIALDRTAAPLVGRTSVVVPGERDGAPVMVKLALDPRDAAAEASALRAWGTATVPAPADAEGGSPLACAAGAPPVPRLLATDAQAGALLLEAIVPGTALRANRAAPSVDACAALLLALRAPLPPPWLPSLSERVEWVFALWSERRASEPRARAAVPAARLERGRDAARELAADRAAPRALVQGDLHLGNVLDGGPARGLVAIDPRPCVGDPLFDAVELVLHGPPSVAAARERAALLAARTGDDRDRVIAWCAALAALDAAAAAVRAPAPPRDQIEVLLALAA